MQKDFFKFDRSRGVVWVCDIAGSSRHLNRKETVTPLEEFLPRLHWVANILVEASGGKFIKWTGDGFLAWFETPLHRDLGIVAAAVFRAAWHLTIMINVTQLAVASPKKFRIRHGITYEHDALITRITYPGGHEALDLTGRSVVLAFRLSGIEADFPSIVTEKNLVEAAKNGDMYHIDFKKWSPGKEEMLKFLKGESWGTTSLYLSKNRKPRARSPRGYLDISKMSSRNSKPEKQHFQMIG